MSEVSLSLGNAASMRKDRTRQTLMSINSCEQRGDSQERPRSRRGQWRGLPAACCRAVRGLTSSTLGLVALPAEIGVGLYMLEGAPPALSEMGTDRRHPLSTRLKDLDQPRVVTLRIDSDLDPLARRVKGTKIGPSGPSATPSPCAPSLLISISSSMAGADQEFLVAAAAKDRRWDLPDDGPG
jgi:hypothetical protein